MDAGLTLRPWRDDDAPILARIHPSADDVQQWLELQHRGRAAGDRVSFAVQESDHDDPVAHVVLKFGRSGVGEVGYWTAVHARGRGVAPRALELLCVRAFEEYGLTRLELIHQIDNQASCRVAAKTQFPLLQILPPQPPWPLEGHLHVRIAHPSSAA